jgi:predicted AAA+ superfamily ATPase
VLPDATFVDLLSASESLKYAKDPSRLAALVRGGPKDKWTVIDEVQRCPSLLDEVHALMENHGYRKFVLCGSSARKLKRGAANLLAGRAITKFLLPFTTQELGFAVDPSTVLEYGLLPLVHNAETTRQKEAILKSYVTTYISEEIKAEGLVRDIGSFARFLDVAALTASTQPNISGLSRDAGIGRDTVQGYFEIFADTLIGEWLPAFRPRAKVKEVVRPKFYWFDSGVLNAAAGGFEQPLPKDWNGVLLEHWIHHELKAYMLYNEQRGTVGFWRTPSRTEVDFVWWYGSRVVGIEVKSGTTFRRSYLKGIRALSSALDLHGAYLVYLGSDVLKYEDVEVLPVMDFLKRLWSNKIIPKVTAG